MSRKPPKHKQGAGKHTAGYRKGPPRGWKGASAHAFDDTDRTQRKIDEMKAACRETEKIG